MHKIIRQKYKLAKLYLKKSLVKNNSSLLKFYHCQYVETLFKADDDKLKEDKIKL